MFRTTHATHAVDKEKRNVPKRNKLEKTKGIGSVISRTPLMALRANALGFLAGYDLGNKIFRVVLMGIERNVGKNERLVIGVKIQYSLDECLGEGVKGKIIVNVLPFS